MTDMVLRQSVVSVKQIRIKSNIIHRLTHLQSFHNSQQASRNSEKVISPEVRDEAIVPEQSCVSEL